LVKAPDFDSGMRRFESFLLSQYPAQFKEYWGVAKLVKAPDFDSGMRRFESFLLSQAYESKLRKKACKAPYTLFLYLPI
jgi:hypothetical protein